MSIIGLNHINIHTSDIEKTIKFYKNILNMKEGFRPAFKIPGAWLYAGENPIIHLIKKKNNGKNLNSPIDHIAFEASNFEETKKHLEKAKYNFSFADVPETGVKQIFLSDPNGVNIELNFSIN